MMTLNLMYPEDSEIKFKISHFPDGQQDLTLVQIDDVNVEILSRFNSLLDLELIICATKALQRLKVKHIDLYIPYLMGVRSDRQFVEGGTSYIVDVIAPILNSLNFNSVIMYDVHSDVSMGVINNSINIPNVQLVKWALTQIDNTFEAQNKVALVSPDGGALKKIYETALGASLTCDIIISAKHRDIRTGKLNGFDVPIKEHQLDKKLVWVDDICDGGGTFIGEAIKAMENGHRGKKYLIVTHGIFSAGFEELSKYFDDIYCTNSYKNILKGSFWNYDSTNLVKQLNVF